MPSYQYNTGDSGLVYLNDDGFSYVDLYVQAQYTGQNGEFGDTVTEQLPWAYTANGKREEWRSHFIQLGMWHQLGRIFVDKSQTFTFHLGETGTSQFGGPVDYPIYIQRGDVLSVSRITVGSSTKRAIPYVKANGVWRLAEPYAKHAGAWKQTT